MSLHRCRAWACEERVTAKYLMCYRHWRKVPKNLQSAVYAAYNTRNLGREQMATYVRTVRAATRAVAAVEGHGHTRAGGCWCVVDPGGACEAW